jgi:hypothetical protein
MKPSLRLYPGEDDDLIAFLERAQESGLSLAQAVVTAMRGGIAAAPAVVEIDEADVAEALGDLFF